MKTSRSMAAGLLIGLGGIAMVAAGVFLLKVPEPLPPMKPARPMNVALIICDALRADRVLAVRDGRPVMPYLSSLIRESLYFENAVSPCSWTRPAMTSIFTALYPETHQVYFDDDPGGIRKADILSESIETISMYLKRAGYTTVGVQTNGNLTGKFQYDRGYDTYDYLPDAAGEVVTEKAMERLEQARQPYFLYVHYIDPHVPYAPPEPYRTWLDEFPAPEDEKKTALDFLPYLLEHSDVKLGKKTAMDRPELSDAGRAAVQRLYESDLHYLDDQLRRLVNTLPNRDQTVLIITADHGESFWEHDHLGHGLTCYEEVIRVPLVVHAPGLAAGVRHEPVETLSILPTVAALLGLPPNPQWQGINLLDPANTQNRDVFSWTTGPWASMSIEFNAIRSGEWKLIYDQRNGEAMLFNLKDDPGELKNLAAEKPELVQTLMNRLQAHKENTVAARQGRSRSTVEVDAETQREQKMLGYGKPKTP